MMNLWGRKLSFLPGFAEGLADQEQVRWFGMQLGGFSGWRRWGLLREYSEMKPANARGAGETVEKDKRSDGVKAL